MKKNKEIYYWYFVIGLVIIVIVLKFILDISISKKSQAIPKEYTEISKPISADFDKEIIEELQKKKIISNIDLESIETYKEIFDKFEKRSNNSITKLSPTAIPKIREIYVVEASPSSESAK